MKGENVPAQGPVLSFVRAYASGGMVRMHMPGHKGKPLVGPEPWDLTEIRGADSLYEASGIVLESERTASALFGTARTLYSTEGSSQCIRAMVHLAANAGRGRKILAARNAHRTFLYACALEDCGVSWLAPEGRTASLCACPVSPAQVKAALEKEQAAAVYLTSPDYLGGMQDVAGIARICDAFDTPLMVDNAHGAYTRFLPRSLHPMDLGAWICCDSAHKTLPALTGAAYLHLSPRGDARFGPEARQAMELYGSTSPSYLTLCSLDAVNGYLSGPGPEEIAACAARTDHIKGRLRDAGWETADSDPLKITLRACEGLSGTALAEVLRRGGIECEYADRDHVVLMLTPMNTLEEMERLVRVLGKPQGRAVRPAFAWEEGEKVLSIREAVFAPWEEVPLSRALGRVCASPLVSCPPAVPLVAAGERIGEGALRALAYYGQERIRVVR